MKTTENIYIETPLIYSKPISDIIEREVYLKLENTQPSGSFKLRGISGLCKKKLEEGCKRFIGSSGGNAGLALAYAAFKLNVPCTIFVPNYVPERMLEKLRAYGSEIIVAGNDWQDANDKAIEETEKDPSSFLIHPFDHPEIWKTITSMVIEIKKQLNGIKPSCLVVSVGGGGLLAGTLTGLETVGWNDVPVIGMETMGAECLNLSLKAGKLVSVHLTSIAKTLGARTVCQGVFDMIPRFNFISHVLHDREAIKGCIRLLDDHCFIVEPACGVTLASAYSGLLPQILENNGFDSTGPIILICCGGTDITPEILDEFKIKFEI